MHYGAITFSAILRDERVPCTTVVVVVTVRCRGGVAGAAAGLGVLVALGASLTSLTGSDFLAGDLDLVVRCEAPLGEAGDFEALLRERDFDFVLREGDLSALPRAGDLKRLCRCVRAGDFERLDLLFEAGFVRAGDLEQARELDLDLLDELA